MKVDQSKDQEREDSTSSSEGGNSDTDLTE